MFWRHPKMSSSTQECDVPPKNVWLPPKDRLGPPENVLSPPKKVWGAQIVSWPARECSEIAGLGSAGFSKRTHHDGIGTPKMREFRIECDVSEGLSSLAGNDSVRLQN